MKGIIRIAMMLVLAIGSSAWTAMALEQPCEPCLFFAAPEQFGAVGDGMIDDTTAVNAALASLSPGGRVLLTGKYLISSGNLNVPSNVTIEGTFEAVGTSLNNLTAPYAELNSAIILNSDYTIYLGGGSAVKGLLIRRQGQVFPAANAAEFDGTAIVIAGDDASIMGCMILGFYQAIFSYGYQRQYYNHILGDNINFIAVGKSLDIGRIMDCHAWPFATVGYGPKPSDWLDRGVAYYIYDSADWVKVTNCFALGYDIGFNIVNSTSVSLTGCGVDGAANPNSTGINIYGLCYETRLDSCQVAGQANAIIVNTSQPGVATRIVTQIINCDMWGNLANRGSGLNIVVYAGDVEVSGCHIRNGNSAVYIANSSSRVIIDGNSFDEMVYNPIYNIGGSPTVFIGLNDYGNFPAGSGVVYNMKLQTAATGTSSQSNVLLLPSSGDVFSVQSGTSDFSFINGSFDGRVKVLLFNSALTITSSKNLGGILLSTNSPFTTAAGATLSVILSPSGYWVETGRSSP